MIEHFRDHAANERTFLAWIRTAITIFVFGFVIEKFDLAKNLALHQNKGIAILVGLMGLVLMIGGVLIMVLAIFSYRRNSHFISQKQTDTSLYLRKTRQTTSSKNI